MNPMRPGPPQDRLLPSVLLFSAGALTVLCLPSLPPLIALAGLALPALLPWRWRALYAAAALGLLLTAYRVQAVQESRWPLTRSDEEVLVEGRVASLPQQRLSAGSKETAEEAEGDAAAAVKRDWRFLFEPADQTLPHTVRVAWYHYDGVVRGGDCWRLRLRLRAPHGSLNPGGYDYEAWLFEQGIGATATVREATACEDRSGYRLLRARQHVADRLEAWLPGNPALGLVAGLVVGDRSLLQEQDWDTFRVTGTSHLSTCR